jgi:hypothetical protein
MEQPLAHDPLPVVPPPASLVVAVVAGVFATGFLLTLAAGTGCVVGWIVEMLGVPGAMGVLFFWAAYLGLALTQLVVWRIVSLDVGAAREGLQLDERRLMPWIREVETVTGLAGWVARDPPLPTLDSAFTLGGFALDTPNRRTARRELVRVGAAAACTFLAWVLLAVGVYLYFQGAMLRDLVLFVVAVAPGVLGPVGIATAVWSSAWAGRRALRWTDRIALEGAVLRTDRGTFHVRGPVRVERGVDAAGAWMTVADDHQTLTFGAPSVALDFVAEQLVRVVPREGGADEVPEALRRLSVVE